MTIERIRGLPCWRGEVRAQPLSGGLSNENWKVEDDAGTHVVRFGADYPFHHVARDREVMIARAAHRAGFGPAVEFAAPGVMVTEFLGVKTWGPEDVASAPERVAALLRAFHQRMPTEVEGTGVIFWPFHVIRDYARALSRGGSPHKAKLDGYLALADEMEVAQVPLPIVFGHHDLLPANILETGDRKLWLIDFEYAGFGTAMFDLAGAASNAGMDAERAVRLLTAYFGAPPDAALVRSFAAMQVTSLLREAMWAMVSALHLKAPGVDYAAYADENLEKLDAALARYRKQYG